MKYPFKYPMHLLILVPMIPCLVALTMVIPQDPIRWTVILFIWGLFFSVAINIVLETYVPEKE